MSAEPERLGLWAALSGALAVAVAGLIAWRAVPLVSGQTIAAIAVPWFAMGIVLRIRRDTWGREGRYLDLWSVPHFVTGVLLALLGIGALWVVALVLIWEVIEVVAKVFEHPGNRAVDVGLALIAWPVARAVFDGSFPLW
jgi:ABC-type uncharacterized transport system permease subunit